MVDFEIRDSIGYITINRPEKYNSITFALAQELLAAFKECESPEVRCICLSSVGHAFCAGQDLVEASDPSTRTIEQIVEEQYNPLVRIIRSIEKPVLCAVNGMAVGAGANLALCCDIVIAKESAYFSQAFSQIGLIPDTGGTWILPRLIGFGKASGLMMLAEKVYAPEAEAMGMIYKSVPDDEFESTIQSMTKKLASMPTKGLGLTKRALNHGLSNVLDNQLSIEAQIQSVAFATDDCQEGINAFQTKRKPVFKGS